MTAQASLRAKRAPYGERIRRSGERSRRRMSIRIRVLIVPTLVWVALALGLQTIAYGDATALLRGLDSDDPKALSSGIAAIERAGATPDLPDVLFSAGLAAEHRLHDPARALAIYERILREMPNASAAIAAERRA